MRGLAGILVAACVGLWSGVSMAADAVVEPATEASLPVYTWVGPYAGAFVGYNATNFDQSSGRDFDGDGFIGGVYAGYNLQSGPVVYGVEGDIGASGVEAGGTNSVTNAPIDADSNVFGSLRARVGFAYDPFMVFATGGLAISDKELSSQGVTDDKTHVGYTLGAGVEASVLGNVTSRLEYRYSDFNAKNYDFGTTTTSTGFDEHSIRAGLALKF